MGKLISLDGVDGGGKSTQVQMLQQWLTERGKTCCTFRDPGSTRLGESLREILLHRQEIPLCLTAEMLLYMASRAQLVHEQLQPALNTHDFVITDRFLLANVVYQGDAGGLDSRDIWQVGHIATQGLAPDLTIVLDIPVEIARSRMQRTLDRLESRGEEYFRKVRTGFLSQRTHAGAQSVVVDASQSVASVHEEIVAAVTPLL